LKEAREEAKLESVSRLLGLGLSVEQVAQSLGLAVEIVWQKAQEQSAH
jgi:predicted transposase YdaD